MRPLGGACRFPPWSGRQGRRPVPMRRSTQVRKLRRPNMSRRAPSDVRTSDLVLGVMVVAPLSSEAVDVGFHQNGPPPPSPAPDS